LLTEAEKNAALHVAQSGYLFNMHQFSLIKGELVLPIKEDKHFERTRLEFLKLSQGVSIEQCILLNEQYHKNNTC
jgi:hypothetical protein